MKKILIPLTGLCLLTACNPSSKKQAGDYDIQTELSEVFPENPSREGYEGFQWQTVTGAGLRLWAQCNENLRIVTDASIPGARIERMENGHKQLRTRLFRYWIYRARTSIHLSRSCSLTHVFSWIRTGQTA